MAKINLKVLTDITQSKEELNALSESIKSISNSFSSVKVDKNLTEQIKALTKHYKAVVEAAEKVAKVNYNNEIQAQKLAKVTAQANKAIADESRAIEKSKEQYEKRQKAVNDEIRAQERHAEQMKKFGEQAEARARSREKAAEREAKAAEKAAEREAKAAEKAAEREAKAKESLSSKVVSLRKGYANLLNTIQGSEKNYKKGTFSKIAEEAQANLNIIKKLDPASADYAKTVNLLDKDLSRLSADFAETKTSATNFHGSLTDIVGGFMKFQLAATLVMKPLQLLKSAFDSINETLVETEKSVVALQRVAGSAANADDLYKLAQKYGQTFENVADVTERFAKSGYDWSESIKAAEAALTAMNVAEMDSEQATEGLIAVMKQYGFEIEKLDYIIGVLNKTGDTAAVTTEELLIALQKTGSTAKNANVSFEETVGLITALSEGTAASGQNIGNALRSLFVFTSDDKALETFAGLSDGMAKTVKEYRMGKASILDIWKGLGGELEGMGSQRGTLEDLFGGAALTEDIEAQLTQITDSFAEIYGTAGNYRQNYFIALLDNIDKVKKVTENLGDVTGYSQQENLKYLDTYEAKVNSLTAQWQQMANDEQGFLSFKKSLVEIGNTFLWILDKVGGLRTALTFLATILSSMFGEKIISGFSNLKNAFTSLIASIRKTENAAISLNAKLGIIGIIATAITVVLGVIDTIVEEINDIDKEQQEANNALIKGANESAKAFAESAKQINDYAKRIAELRAITDDSSSSTAEISNAQSELNDIQSILSQGTSEYAKQLDLVNGNLKTQLGLVEDLSDAELKAKALEFLNENKTAINLADTAINGSTETTTNIVLQRDQFEHSEVDDITNEIIKRSGVSNVSTNQWLGVSLLNPIANVAQGFGSDDEYDVWKMIDDLLTAPFEGETYAGATKMRLDLSGTVDEQISSLESMIDAVKQSGTELGLSNEEIAVFVKALSDEITKLKGNGYEDSKELLELSKVAEQFANGEISREEYLEKFYGIVNDTKEDIGKIRDDLADLEKEELQKILEKVEQIRNATKDAYEYEEKKKAVLEAEKALLDAQHNRTVRVLNEATGQWEWVSNAKEVEDAKDNLAKARADVEDAFFNEVEDALKTGNVTSAGILAIIAKWASAYGSGDFSALEGAITDVIKEMYGIDLRAYYPTGSGHVGEIKPSNTTTKENADGSYIIEYEDGSKLVSLPNGQTYVEYADEDGVMREYDDGSRKYYNKEGSLLKQVTPEGITYEYGADGSMTFTVNGSSIVFDAEAMKAIQASANQNSLVYDSGGVLKGMGGIKATTEDEVVLDPSITKQLLTPVSNQQFDTFVKDLGLLFGMSKSTTNHGAVFGAGLYGHDSHDNHYSVNGVPIPVESAQKYTIAELFENMNLIPNI